MKTIYSPPYRQLLELLQEARMMAGVTQTQLSEKLDKPQSYVSKYENGERRLDVIEFLQVCEQLGTDPHKLIKKINR